MGQNEVVDDHSCCQLLVQNAHPKPEHDDRSRKVLRYVEELVSLVLRITQSNSGWTAKPHIVVPVCEGARMKATSHSVLAFV